MPPDLDLIRRAFAVATPGAPRWSPTGERLAYALSQPDVDVKRSLTSIWLHEPARARHWAAVTGLEGEGAPLAWSPDGQRLAFIAKRDELTQIELLNLQTEELRVLAPADSVHGPIATFERFVTLDWSPDGARLLYVAQAAAPAPVPDPVVDPRNDGDGYGEIERLQVWSLAVDGKAAPIALTSADFHSGAAAWSPDGARVVFVSNRSGREEGMGSNLNQPFELWTVAAVGGRETKLTDGPGANVAPAWSPDGAWLAFLGGPRYGSHADVMAVQIVRADGGERRVLGGALDRSVHPIKAPLWLSNDEFVICVADGVRNRPYRVGLEGGPTAIEAERPFVSDVAARPGGDAIAWIGQSGVDPPEVEITTLDGELQWRSEHNGQIRPDAEVRSLRTVVADGDPQEALLAAPREDTAAAPVILNPHGGPHGRATLEYRPDWHAYAAHGYAVLSPNFRGSAGYGQAFVDADRFDLGGGDFADCLAALETLLASGLGNSRRCFITGTSYGGFLTVWAIGHTDRFVAAVAVNAVTNLQSFFGQTDIPSWVRWEVGGTPLQTSDAIRDRSPIEHLADASTPTLVVHSADDRRVPIAQGLELLAALRSLELSTGFVRYPRESHRIAEPAHRVDLVCRTLAWFERHYSRRIGGARA